MRYNVKIEKVGHEDAAKKIAALYKISKIDADAALRRGGNFLSNVLIDEAARVKKIVEFYGGKVNLIPTYSVYEPAAGVASDNADRRALYDTYRQLLAEESCVESIREKDFEINRIHGEIELLKHRNEYQKKKYEENTKKKPFFHSLKWFFLITIALLVISIIICAVISFFVSVGGNYAYEHKIRTFEAMAQLFQRFFKIGAPVSLVLSLMITIYLNREFARDRAKEAQKAKEYLEENTFEIEYDEKNSELQRLEQELTDYENRKPDVQVDKSRLILPDDLKSVEGIALLLKYIDSGRAVTKQEAINLYYQELDNEERKRNDALRTEYARRQAEKAEEALNVARETLEQTEKMKRAQERAADEAAAAAHYGRQMYWDNVFDKAKNK